MNSNQIPLPPPRDNWYLEIVFGSGLVVYIVFFFIGKGQNEAIARNWAKSMASIFESNFSRIGAGITPIDPKAGTSESFVSGTSLLKESHTTYKLKATGRVNCVGLQATLQLKRRQDLLGVLYEIFFKTVDTVTIDVLMNDEVMEPFSFCVLKSKEEKKYRKTMKDLSSFVSGTASVEELSEVYSVISEIDDITGTLLHPQVIETLNNYSKYFIRMHFTDQGLASATYRKSLQFVFEIPPASEMDKLALLTKMVIYYIDLVPVIKLSKFARAKSDKHRAELIANQLRETHQQRQEAAQQRKMEKLQKEKAELEQLTPEARAKKEEKLAKKDAKRRQPKQKVIMG